MTRKQSYEKYEKSLCALSASENVTEKDLNELFDELLGILPNGGKLYKYKSLKTFHMDELEEKYVWFSSAKDLNDHKDCALNIKVDAELESLVRFLRKGDNFKKLLIKGAHCSLSKYNSKITKEIVEKLFLCVDRNDGKIIGLKVDHFCKEYKLNSRQKDELENGIKIYKSYAHGEEETRYYVKDIKNKIEEMRNCMHVFSLTTSFKKDSMWAYYCQNEGICIEYDFTKIKSLDTKKLFKNTLHVKYRKKNKFSLVEILEASFMNTEEAMCDAEWKVQNQYLTKDKSWSMEDEWRVMYCNKNSSKGKKVPLDIISAIYIDYSVLDDERAKHIVALAGQNGWKIYVRYFNQLENEYCYETIEKVKKLEKQWKDRG